MIELPNSLLHFVPHLALNVDQPLEACLRRTALLRTRRSSTNTTSSSTPAGKDRSPLPKTAWQTGEWIPSDEAFAIRRGEWLAVLDSAHDPLAVPKMPLWGAVLVTMMESADFRHRNNPPHVCGLDRARSPGGGVVQSEVCPAAMIGRIRKFELCENHRSAFTFSLQKM